MPEEKGTTPKIMSMPLPEILDELENYIQRVEEAVKASQQAAEESQTAAAEAKAAGQEAAVAARKAAEAAVAKVGQAMQDAFTEIRAEMAAIRKISVEALTIAKAMNVGIVAAVKAYNEEIEKIG